MWCFFVDMFHTQSYNAIQKIFLPIEMFTLKSFNYEQNKHPFLRSLSISTIGQPIQQGIMTIGKVVLPIPSFWKSGASLQIATLHGQGEQIGLSAWKICQDHKIKNKINLKSQNKFSTQRQELEGTHINRVPIIFVVVSNQSDSCQDGQWSYVTSSRQGNNVCRVFCSFGKQGPSINHGFYSHKKRKSCWEKIFSVFGGHLTFLNMPPRKEEGSFLHLLPNSGTDLGANAKNLLVICGSVNGQCLPYVT